MQTYGEYLENLYSECKSPRERDDIFWGELTRTFPPEHIKTRPGGGGTKLDFIQPRAVMHRLDEVVGPGNWEDSYEQRGDSVLCTLRIKQLNGEWVTKQDAGNCDGTKDEGDNDKGGYSDALKRAAVKFGIGRHLYRDLTGLTYFAKAADDRHAEWQVARLQAFVREDLKAKVDAKNAGFVANCVKRSVVVPDAEQTPFVVDELIGYIVNRASEDGKINSTEDQDFIQYVIDVSGDEEWFDATIKNYFKKATKDKVQKYLK